MPITVRFSQHVRGMHGNVHFGDPRRVQGIAYRTAYRMEPRVRWVQAVGYRPDGTYGQVTMQQAYAEQVEYYVAYTTWVVQGTTTPWNDNAISSHNGITYFPASTSQNAVLNWVQGQLEQTLVTGQAGGTQTLNPGGYSIHVAWQPDSPAADNQGFTVTQMYPF